MGEMDILVRGEEKDVRLKWLGKCHDCLSIIRFNEGEIRDKIHSDQRDGSWARPMCPVCGSKMTVHPETPTLRDELIPF